MKPVRMQDIAEKAGVARSTVSMALRNDPSLPAATRERIQRVAAELGYRPNPMVAALMADLRMQRRTAAPGKLGFLCPASVRQWEREWPTFRRQLHGMRAQADRLGYQLEEISLAPGNLTPKRACEILDARGIPGLILGPFPAPTEGIALEWEKLAVVTIGYSLLNVPIHRANAHQHHDMMLAVENLRRLGYRRMGLAIEAAGDRRVYHHWLAAFLAREYYSGDRGRLPVLVTGTLNRDELIQWVRSERPDAIISYSPQIPGWLTEAGYDVPGDLGFVNLDVSLDFPYAGIDQNHEQVGSAAVDLIVEQLHQNQRGLQEHPKVVLVSGRWVEGPTVRPQ